MLLENRAYTGTRITGEKRSRCLQADTNLPPTHVSQHPQTQLGCHRPLEGLWLPRQQIFLQMACCSETKPEMAHSFYLEIKY